MPTHPEQTPKGNASPHRDAPFEEIAEDLVDVLERLHRVEAGQRDIVRRIDALDDLLRTTSKDQRRDLREFRREASGESRAMSALHVFRAVIPFVDQLEEMLPHLDSDEDSTTIAQLKAVRAALQNTLRDLGFTTFTPEVGAPFAPGSMECIGLPTDQDTTVKAVHRVGYSAGETVVRVATVSVGEAPSQQREVENNG